MRFLWSMLVLVVVMLVPVGLAQGGEGGSSWLTEAGLAWIAAATAFAAAGTPFTREIVDYLRDFSGLERWLKRRFGSNGLRFLAFVVALGWTAFWFQPGFLNLPGLLTIPWWVSIPVLAAVIAWRAGGQKNAQRQGLSKLEAVTNTVNITDPSSLPAEKRGS
jgi:hypothetical protein